jgi:cytidine deaminase
VKVSKAVKSRLVSEAKAARRNAMCGQSGYAVGAAVLTSSGKIFRGCNIETETLISHICAERAAIFNAIVHGEREIRAVSTVCASSLPCGACRQMIREFSDGDIPIFSVLTDGGQRLIETTISKLLPQAHTAAQLRSVRRKSANKGARR